MIYTYSLFPPKEQIRVIDGDSIALMLDYGNNVASYMTLRILGVDCPEIGTNAGKAVKKVVERWISQIQPDDIRIESHGLDKYKARFDGHIRHKDEIDATLASFLLEYRLARRYDGGKRDPWSEDELKAVEKAALKMLEK
jgi:endonuclease YncB( thermonuclease family)